MVLVSYILDNHISILQTKLRDREGHEGLAAASVPKPTVAQYTQYFSYLQAPKLVKESRPHGEASRHEVTVMLANFPKKDGSMGERRVNVRGSHHAHLKTRDFSKKVDIT
jgi:hypothetical protein